jgi:hypothetical protein
MLGDPSIKPNDVVFFNDYYTDMHGAVEVREVTHHFSHESGFVTTIVPDCISYANNSMAQASEAVAGGWYDDVADSMLWVYKVKLPFVGRLGLLGTLGVAAGIFLGTGLGPAVGIAKNSAQINALAPSRIVGGKGLRIARFIKNVGIQGAKRSAAGVGKIAGWAGKTVIGKIVTVPMIALGVGAAAELTGALPRTRSALQGLTWAATGWTVTRREPLNFLPLMYAGRPYIAGIRGFRRSCWWEPTSEGWKRFVYYRLNQAPRFLANQFDRYFDDQLTAAVKDFRTLEVNR